MRISEIIGLIESVAPLESQLDFDNSGLLVGDKNCECSKVLVTVDVTLDAVKYAKEIGANLIVSHHPIIFYPIKNILSSTVDGAIIIEAIRNEITLYASHTNFDNAKGGITDGILQHFEVFNATPVYEDGTGRVALIKPMHLEDVARIIRNISGDANMRIQGDMKRLITKMAVINGAGGRDESLADKLYDSGVELFVTGEVKHSFALLLKARGIALIDVGHYHAEKIFNDLMATLISASGVDVVKYYDSNPYNN